MAAHLGIELSPGFCRIVEVDVHRKSSARPAARLRRFDVFALGGSELRTVLGTLRGRSAAVVVWGAPGDHRQVMVHSGSYDAMRREARRALALAGVETRGAMFDIARVPSDADAMRRPVVVALANGAALRRAVQPLLAAGIEIRTLATPPVALLSLARVFRNVSTARHETLPSPDERFGADAVAVDASIALREFTTCIALLRDGALVASRELSWGFQAGRRGELRRQEDVVSRLEDELAEFLMASGGSIASVRRIALCGGASDLRTVAAMLTARLEVEVDPLDVPIDGELDDATHARRGDLWLALAVAVDQRAPLSLVHARHRETARNRWAHAAIAAGVATGIVVGYETARSPLFSPVPQTVHQPARKSPPHKPANELVAREDD